MPLVDHVAELVAWRRRSPRRPCSALHLLDDDRAVLAGVDRDAAQRLLERARRMFAPVCSSPSSVELVERGQRVDQGDAAAGDDALFDRRAGRRQRVLDAVLLLLQLDLGRGADLDDGDAAGELAEALLQLLAVPVGRGRLERGLDLARRGPRSSFLAPLPSMMVVSLLGDDDAAGAAQVLDRRRSRACGRSPR